MRLPIKLRLTLVFGIAMAVVLAGLGWLGYLRVESDLLASVDAGLRSRAQVIANSLGHTTNSAAVLAEGRLIDADEAFAQILASSGEIVETTSAVANAPLLSAGEIKGIVEPFFVSRQNDEIGRYESLDDPFRLFAVPVSTPTRGIVVVGATLSDVNAALQRLLEVMLTIGPFAIVLTAAAGWLLAGATLRPVEHMRREAAAISAFEPGRRLPVPNSGDELARLATTLNSMLDRLQGAIERERRFVDNASHELRTPLATLRGEIELALARKRPVPELEAALRSAQEDVDRLQRLADDLLVLARARGGRLPVRRIRARLQDLAERSVQSVATQARDARVTIDVEASDDRVELDPDRIHQALRNLLENAIRHTPAGGNVRIEAARAGGKVRFAVEDSGPGFPPEQLADIFDPFTRASDEGRSPSGNGLGLAIVRAVAEAHGGSVSATNTTTGARITVEVHT